MSSQPVVSQQSSSTVYSVEQIAEILHLSKEKHGRKNEWHGANPLGMSGGATEDGFILYQEGNGYDRKLDKPFTSKQVAEMAGIKPIEYAPYKEHIDKSGMTTYQDIPRGTLDDDDAPVEKSKPEPKPEKKYDQRTIEERGVNAKTIEHFNIEKLEHDSGIRYPTFFADGERSGRSREKFYNPVEAGTKYNKSKKPMKYRWTPNDNDPEPAGYNLAACNDESEIYLVGGELDVWLCHQVGIKAVSGFGETRNIDKLIKELDELGIEMVHICLDNDDSGHKGAIKVADACAEHEIKFTIREIIGFIGSDVANICERLEFDPIKCKQAIETLPIAKRESINRWRGVEDESSSTKAAAKKKKASSKDEKIEKAESLVTLLEDKEYFYSDEEDYYIILDDGNGVMTTYPFHDSKLESRLINLFYDTFGKMITSETVNASLNHMKGRANTKKDNRPVWIRSGYHEETGTIYIDLNHPDNLMVKINGNTIGGDGWEIVSESPVFFRRPKGVKPLPIPVHLPNGNKDAIMKMKSIINSEKHENWVLMLAWLSYALHPPLRPYPVLSINGEQGTAKSTTCKILRKLVDPNFTLMIGGSIRDERDLAIMAKNSFVLGFDNISGLQKWQSDALSQIVTEGGFRTRKLHSNDEEILFSARRPIILNGIEQLIGREDFRNRSLVCTLPVIEENQRRDEEEVWNFFDDNAPGALGWVFSTMATAMGNLNDVAHERMPRMADFAKWVLAAEIGGAFPWDGAKFMDAYVENRRDIQEASVESNPLSSEIRKWMDEVEFIEETPTDLLKKLNNRAEHESMQQTTWPKGANALSNALRRISPEMRAVGINVVTGVKSSRGDKRLIKITKVNSGNRI